MTALYLHRRGRATWHSWAIIPLKLTSCSGLQAIWFWVLRGDYDLAWWAPNPFLLLYPAIFLPRLSAEPTLIAMGCLRDGGRARVTSRVGEVVAPVKVTLRRSAEVSKNRRAGDTPECSTLSIAQVWFSPPYGFGDTVAGHSYAFDPGTECQAAVPDQGSAAIQFGGDPISF